MKKNIFEKLYFLFWCLLAASIPLSKFTTSLFMFAAFGAWLFSDSWVNKIINLRKNKIPIILTTSLFFMFVLGLWNTENWTYAIKDLRIKLPLLLIPFTLLTGPIFTKKQLLRTFWFLATGAVTSALIGYYNYLFLLNQQVNFRALSPFISHIRLSLMLCFALVLFGYHLLTNQSKKKWFILIPLAFVLFYLSELQSLTALVILPFLLLGTLYHYPPWKSNNQVVKISFILTIGIFLFLGYKINKVYQIEFRTIEIPKNLPEYTVNGNPYYHKLKDPRTENGNFVGLYISDAELSKEWKKVSELSLQTKVNEFPLRSSLLRFLTSKNLTKDSLGFSQLSTQEIKAIEKGIANYRYMDGKGIETRIHTALWEIRKLNEGIREEGSSVTMRLFLWKSALTILKNHPWTGVGTGDVADEIKQQYNLSIYSNYTRLLRTHNQYLTVGISHGIIGILVFVLLFFYPFFTYQGAYKYLYLSIILILGCSMLWEDTLETQTGVAVFALLFYLPFAQYLQEKSSQKSP